MFSFRSSIALSAFAVLASTSHAAGYDAFSDFSTTNNPNGVWSYGYTVGSGFVASPAYAPSGSVAGWTDSSVASYLGVYLASTSLLLHPGDAANEKAVLRFTAPTAGQYKISLSFANGDNATTDFALAQNGVSLWSGAISPSNLSSSQMLTLNLAAGDTLDAIVGYGSNGNYYNDSTLVNMSLQSVPGPAAMIPFALGLVAKRRRRA